METGQRTGEVQVGTNGVVTVILDSRNTVAAFPNAEGLAIAKQSGAMGAHLFGVMQNTAREGTDATAVAGGEMSNQDVALYIAQQDPAAEAAMLVDIAAGVVATPLQWAQVNGFPLPNLGGGSSFGETSTVTGAAGQFRLIGVRGRYASGNFETDQIMWTFDSHSGITGNPHEVVDGMHIIASQPMQLNVAWGGRDE